MGKFKVPVFSSVANALMQPCNLAIQLMAIARAFLLVLKPALEQFQLPVQ